MTVFYGWNWNRNKQKTTTIPVNKSTVRFALTIHAHTPGTLLDFWMILNGYLNVRREGGVCSVLAMNQPLGAGHLQESLLWSSGSRAAAARLSESRRRPRSRPAPGPLQGTRAQVRRARCQGTPSRALRAHRDRGPPETARAACTEPP
mmetsp:Transcript_135698/g.246756  ORF Transcript_135698/g.246756 Transcript_135698/m.246756 type:complete len:148 (-) Transcript_135698:289-732(-)